MAADAAELYRWRDATGAVRYTNSLDAIPREFRATAEDLGAPQPRWGGAGAAASDESPEPDARGAATGAVGTAADDVRPPAAEDEGLVPLTPGGQVRVRAVVNGVAAMLLVDTGADRTVISPAVLERAGVGVQGARTVSIVGVTGSAAAPEVTVPRLDVAGAMVGPLAVIAHDIGTPGLDGLLGRDVLDFFILTVDSRAGHAVLHPR